jgi:hypothetical protein
MAIYRKSNTTIYAKMQTAKGSAATVAGANAVDVLMESTFVQPKGNLIDRGLVRGGRWPSKKAVGGRWGEGPLNLELRGSGTAGTQPEFGPLLETLFGTATVNAAGTVADAAASTTEFDSALDLTVGQLIRVAIGSSNEVRRVATKTGEGPYTYTVHRAFSGAPADEAVIAAGVTYHHLGSEAESYLTLEQFLDGVKLLCTDACVEKLDIGVTEKEVIKGTFALRSITCAESDTADGLTPTFDDTDPLIGTSCNLLLDSSALNMKSMELSLMTRRERGGINSTGISDLPFASKFDATCKLAPWVENDGAFTAFFAGSLADIEMTKGTVAGNILHLLVEDVQREGPSIGDDDGDFSWDDPLTVTGGIAIGFF